MMQNDDQIISLWSKVVFEAIYSIVTVIFLFRLRALNAELKEGVDVTNPFEIVMYNDASPLWFSLGALILVGLAVGLIIWTFNTASREHFFLPFFILFIIVLVLNIAAIILIWNFINNPILRAVIIVIITGFGALYAMSHN